MNNTNSTSQNHNKKGSVVSLGATTAIGIGAGAAIGVATGMVGVFVAAGAAVGVLLGFATNAADNRGK